MLTDNSFTLCGLTYTVLLGLMIGGMGCKTDNKMAEKELWESIRTFNEAFKNGDITTLSHMIPQDYQHTNGTSTAIGREAWLSYLSTRQREITEGKLVVLSYEMQEEELTMYPNMGILTAKIVSKYSVLGEEKENSYRVTNIWVKEEGRWKRAAFHDGKIL